MYYKIVLSKSPHSEVLNFNKIRLIIVRDIDTLTSVKKFKIQLSIF